MGDAAFARRRNVALCLVTVLAAAAGQACSGGAPPIVEAPTPQATLPAPQAAPAPFVPTRADPERKAKLVALAERLDAHYAGDLAAGRGTGAAVGIVLDGELVYARGFGVRDVETNTPVDTDTVFRVASVTKNVTATAVLKLRDEGMLSLDVPVTTYVPELVVRPLPRDSTAPTVRQLLTMSSGLPYDDRWGAVTFGRSDVELDRMMRSGIVLASAPGERYAYSNLGYALLGEVVERVSGQPFRDYVTTKVFLPLGMRSSVWEPTDVPPARMALGYYRDEERLVAEPRPSDGVFAPAGGLYTSMTDYARYVAFQLAAYPPRDEPESGPVRRSTLREMHAGERWMRWGDEFPVATRNADGRLRLSTANYGFGWVRHATCFHERVVQHGGFEPGYFAYVRLLPDERLGIVTFSTTGPIGRLQSFETVVGMLREAGILTQRAVPPPHELLEASSVVIRLLETWDGSLVERAFDPQSLRYSWVKNLGDKFAALSRDHGRCYRKGTLHVLSTTEARFRLSCDRGELVAQVWLTPELPQRIQAVDVKALPVEMAEGMNLGERPTACSEEVQRPTK